MIGFSKLKYNNITQPQEDPTARAPDTEIVFVSTCAVSLWGVLQDSYQPPCRLRSDVKIEARLKY